jgi:xanthine dehydrogenase accessory factor
MASGVIHRLSAEGYAVIALEQAAPVCVRRSVCFAAAVFEGQSVVEGVTAVLASSAQDALEVAVGGQVAVLVDPEAEQLPVLQPQAVVDARMLKREVQIPRYDVPMVIGLGPGFTAGKDCDAVVETQRGPDLGRVILKGQAQSYTGVPAAVNGVSRDRVLRSPGDGAFTTTYEIGEIISAGEQVGTVSHMPVVSQIGGVVRGLLRSALSVSSGQKLGDIDPRGEKERCFQLSGKARAIGQGTLEALRSLNHPV